MVKGPRGAPPVPILLAAGLILLLSLPHACSEAARKGGGTTNSEKPSDVILLDADNFARLTKKGTWFINFYAPWCGHCKRMAPIWEQLATKLKSSSVNIAKLDADEHQEIAEEYLVRAYPTFKVIAGDAVVEYNGENSLDAFVNFIEEYQKRGLADAEEAVTDAATGPVVWSKAWRLVSKFAARAPGLYTVAVGGSGFFFGVLCGVLFAVREKDKLD